MCQEPVYINMEEVGEELPELPLSPPPVDDVPVGARAPPSSPVEAPVLSSDQTIPQLEAAAIILGDRGAGSRRSTRSQPGELVAGLASDRRSNRKLSVSYYIL